MGGVGGDGELVMRNAYTLYITHYNATACNSAKAS